MPRQTRKLKETKTSAKKGKDIVGNHLAIRSPGSWSRLNDGNLLNPTLLEGLHGVTVPLQLAVRNLRFNKYYTPLARLNPHKRMAPDWPSHRLNVESTVDFPEQNMKKWQIHWATMPRPSGHSNNPRFCFLGSKKSLGHFPDLNWFGVSSNVYPIRKLWCIHFNEEQKLSTMWGISIRLSAEKTL